MHTSTITVAVLPLADERATPIPETEIEWHATRGSGAGGQHRNVTDSAVVMTHVPTGITCRAEGERSQHANRARALEVLRARVSEQARATRAGERADARRAQVGSGMRGDKRRTIRTQDDQVNDHEDGRAWRYRDYVRGIW